MVTRPKKKKNPAYLEVFQTTLIHTSDMILQKKLIGITTSGQECPQLS